MVRSDTSEYRKKDKTNLGNSTPKKMKCSPNEDKTVKNDNAAPSSSGMDSATPTKIIDIAQTYSQKSLFLDDGVSLISFTQLYEKRLVLQGMFSIGVG